MNLFRWLLAFAAVTVLSAIAVLFFGSNVGVLFIVDFWIIVAIGSILIITRRGTGRTETSDPHHVDAEGPSVTSLAGQGRTYRMETLSDQARNLLVTSSYRVEKWMGGDMIMTIPTSQMIEPQGWADWDKEAQFIYLMQNGAYVYVGYEVATYLAELSNHE